MHRLYSILLAVATLAATAGAQSKIVVPVGSEAFPDLQYQGGDASQLKRMSGMLVLSDSAVAFYLCYWDCENDSRKPAFWDKPTLRIPYSAIRDITHNTLTKTPQFVADNTMEFFTVVYEHDGTVDAPLFKTKRATSAAIEAKLKYRMKKLGFAFDAK